MNGIYVNYDPFAMESQVILIEKGLLTAKGKVHYRSDPDQLSDDLLHLVQTAFNKEKEVKVFVHAPKVFYDKLSELVQAQKTQYNMTQTIILERISQ